VGVALPHLLNLGDKKLDGLGIRFPQSTIGQPRANRCDDEVAGHARRLSCGGYQLPFAFCRLAWGIRHESHRDEHIKGFAEATRSFWKNYATFKGRARRSEYWFIQLFLVLTNLAAFFIDLALLGGDLERIMAMGGGGIVGLVWILATIVPALAVLIRRLHDTDKSAWWVLIGLVPFAGGIVLLVFTVQDSTPGDNKHGASPKALQE